MNILKPFKTGYIKKKKPKPHQGDTRGNQK